MRLAIPSMLMLCLEWWLFEVGAFLAGQISEAELGAQSITYELAVIAYMVTAPGGGDALARRRTTSLCVPADPHGPVGRRQRQSRQRARSGEAPAGQAVLQGARGVHV